MRCGRRRGSVTRWREARSVRGLLRLLRDVSRLQAAASLTLRRQRPWPEKYAPSSPPPLRPPMTDRNVESVRAKLLERSQRGIQKYGVTTERDDLSSLDWLEHLQQELMDAIVYIEALKRQIRALAEIGR